MASACEDAWETGSPAPDRTKYPVWMKPSKQCTFDFDGKRVYVAPTSEEALRTYIDSRRIVKKLAKDGVYTWLLYRTSKDGELQFAASRVKSVLELGTLHRAIAFRTKAKTVHGAGELKKDGKTVQVNVQSGSFMVEWKLPKSCDLKEMGDLVLDKVEPFLEGLDMDISHTDSFITDALAPTKKEIAAYARKGLVVCTYDDEAECKKDKAKGCMVKGGTRRRKVNRRITRRS